ncbi:MAG: trypsin-like peptidase domain-containing protein [Rhizobiaceae bacterium]
MSNRQKAQENAETRSTVAVLDHLSGPSIGLQTLLFSELLDVYLTSDRLLSVSGVKRDKKPDADRKPIARLTRAGDSYHLDAAEDAEIWINGRKVHSAELHDDDIIEFGEKGPLSRFRLIDSSVHQRRYFAEICDDCWDYILTSRKPVYTRVPTAIAKGIRRIAGDSTILFRTTVVVLIVLLGYLLLQQYNINRLQQIELTENINRLENFAKTLSRTREEALTPNDLIELKSGLSRDLDASTSRLEELEKRSSAIETVVKATSASVVFLQGSYGYREASTGRVMRHVLGPTGRPLVAPNGAPLLSLDGDGPIAERTYTGTGFAIGDGSLLVTNRHVAVPWTSDDSSAGLKQSGTEPFMIRLIGYSPGKTEPAELELLKASDDTDLAVLRLVSGEQLLTPLPIASGSPAQGRSVVVLGYPTGLRSMVARSGGAFIEGLQNSEKTGFWDVAEKLSEKQLIKPLASLGIVAQTTTDFVVYDAATTRGGSGGPVLNTKGEVVAVTVAILPEYGGSNLGIPAEKLEIFVLQATELSN